VVHNAVHWLGLSISTWRNFMADSVNDFQKFRSELNEEILGCGHLGIKRFFALDHQAYEPGPLGTKTKELLNLGGAE
jgi:hypothetical protein